MMTSKTKILIVDDDTRLVHEFRSHFEKLAMK